MSHTLATLAGDGRTALTTSLAVAEKFGKHHRNVLQAIRNLECPQAFTELNFKLSEYIDPTGRKLPMYDITRDGFAVLAMGFTGPEALRWKIAFLDAFNALESAWRDSPLAQLALRDLNLRRRAGGQPLQQQAYLSGLLGGGRVMCEHALALAEDYLRNPPPALPAPGPGFPRRKRGRA